MSKKKKKRHFVLHLLLGLAAAGLMMFLTVLIFLCVRENQAKAGPLEEKEYDAVIVLGAQVLPDGTPSVQLAWRLDAAFEAWQCRDVPVVVCGAKGGDEPEAEAYVMQRYLSRKGIPQDRILTDPESYDTRQNLRNAQALLSDFPDIGRVLIVTSDYHLPRAMAIAGDLGLRTEGLGSPCKSEYWLKNHLRETLGWFKYWAVKYLHLNI